MTDINFNASVFAIKKETTEGTPVVPAAAGDFIATQDDFSMSPQTDVLENAELRSSIGRAKPVLGNENPTASGSFYLRHSGVEGTKPNYHYLLEGAFGTETTHGTERNTVANSTTTLIKVDSGEGAEFSRGHPLLIKDGTNGYAIRPVHSVSTDDLTIGFALANAPASGVDLGDAIFYSPANSGHPSLCLWHYLGNQGAIQMGAGFKVTSMDITINAGEYINANYSLEGLEYFFNPIVIGSTNKYIDWTDDGGTEAASVAEGTYKDPHELAAAIAAAMNAETDETITCVYSDSTGKFTIATSTSAVLSLLWNDGTNAANSIATTIGFATAANDTSATTYTSDNAISLAAAYTPSYDSADPLVAKNMEVLIGDGTETTSFEPDTITINVANTRAVKGSVAAASGRSGSIITERAVTINVTGYLQQYDVDKYRRYRAGTETRFLANAGTKTGGNWVAGTCVSFYAPTTTVTAFNITNQDGLVKIEFELQAYVDTNGNGEVYLGFV